MDVRSIELPLKGFGAPATLAQVEFYILSPGDRLKRAAVIFVAFLVAVVVFLPVPLVHLVIVPGALVFGSRVCAGTVAPAGGFPFGGGPVPILRGRAAVYRTGELPGAQDTQLFSLPAAAGLGRFYQRTATLPHMKPEPNAVSTRRSPR